MGWWKRINIMERVRNVNITVTVEVMTFLYFFAFAVGLIAYQQTLYIKLCTRQGYNVSLCANKSWEQGQPALQLETSHWMIYTNVAVLLPLLFCLTALSGYSDRNSLTLALALPLAGSILTSAWIILQTIYIDWDPALLLIAAAGWGLTGYFPTVNMAGMTYLIRDKYVGNLAVRIAVLEGMQMLAGAIGTAVAGPILDTSAGAKTGLIAAWIVCAVTQVIALADVLFRVKKLPPPEHLTASYKKQPITFSLTIKRCFNLDSFKSYFKAVFRQRDNSKRLHFHIVVVATMIGNLALAGMTNIVFLYLTKQYGKSNTEYSIYQFLNSITSLIGNTVLIYIFTTVYKLSDIGFTILGAASTAISYTLVGYANYAVPYWLAVAFRLCSSYIWVGGRLYITHTLNEKEQAAGMGYYATVQCITTIIASVVFNTIYPATLHFWPGLSFAVCALLTVLIIPVLTFVKWNDIRHGCDN